MPKNPFYTTFNHMLGLMCQRLGSSGQTDARVPRGGSNARPSPAVVAAAARWSIYTDYGHEPCAVRIVLQHLPVSVTVLKQSLKLTLDRIESEQERKRLKRSRHRQHRARMAPRGPAHRDRTQRAALARHRGDTVGGTPRARAEPAPPMLHSMCADRRRPQLCSASDSSTAPRRARLHCGSSIGQDALP